MKRQKNQKWSAKRPINLPNIASRSPLKSTEQMVYLVKGGAEINKIWQAVNYRPELKRPTMVFDKRPCLDEKGTIGFKVIRAIYDAETGMLRPTMTEMSDMKLVITGVKRDNLSFYRGKTLGDMEHPKSAVWGLEAFVFQPPNRARPDKKYDGLPGNDFSCLTTWSEVALSYDSMRAHGVMMLKNQALPFTMAQHFLYEESYTPNKDGEKGGRIVFDVMGQRETFSSKLLYIVRDLANLNLDSIAFGNATINAKLPKDRRRKGKV